MHRLQVYIAGTEPAETAAENCSKLLKLQLKVLKLLLPLCRCPARHCMW